MFKYDKYKSIIAKLHTGGTLNSLVEINSEILLKFIETIAKTVTNDISIDDFLKILHDILNSNNFEIVIQRGVDLIIKNKSYVY